jgi:hypothetical protein
MLQIKQKNKDILIPLVQKLINYEYNLSKIILKYLKNFIISEYFSKYRVEVWYCYIHDQGFMIEFLNSDTKIEDIYTKTCCNYCHLTYLDNFNNNFIENYYSKHRYVDFKLSWFIHCFYDYQKDEFIKITPLPIILLYQNILSRKF